MSGNTHRKKSNMEVYKICPKCKENKNMNQYNRGNVMGFFHWCRACQNAYNRGRYVGVIPRKYYTHTKNGNRKFRVRNYKLYHKYGIIYEEYEDMYLAVCGHCQICGRYREVLNVDHNHSTGEIRGLLCSSCNTDIGRIFENPKYPNQLSNIIKYLGITVEAG